MFIFMSLSVLILTGAHHGHADPPLPHGPPPDLRTLFPIKVHAPKREHHGAVFQFPGTKPELVRPWVSHVGHPRDYHGEGPGNRERVTEGTGDWPKENQARRDSGAVLIVQVSPLRLLLRGQMGTVIVRVGMG